MWKIAYVLPNIIIGTSIETDYLALVDSEDERISEIIRIQPNSSKLLDGFLDDYNKPIKPSVMIYKEGFPENAVSIDSMVAFRNIIAISIILLNWTLDYSKGSPMGPLFSNSFDFYPITIGKDGSLTTITPGLRSFSSDDAPFLATPSREVARVDIGFYDSIIFDPLIQLWRSKFESSKDENIITRKIFRSLEMSYYALSIPMKNESSIYDFGLMISLWISAIEILLKPNNAEKKVNKFVVIDKLVNHEFKDEKLKNSFSVIERDKKEVEINFIQSLYLLVYNYRSKFIHGDEMDQEIIQFIKSYPKLSILNIGPNLYRLILFLFLKDNNLIEEKEKVYYLDGFREYIINNRYEEYFLNVLNSKNNINNENEDSEDKIKIQKTK